MSLYIRPKHNAGITLQDAKAKIEVMHWVKEVNICNVGGIPTLEVLFLEGASNKKVKNGIFRAMGPHPFSIWVIRDDDPPTRR